MKNDSFNDFIKIQNFKSIEIDFGNKSWHHIIPSVPGWYYIETTAPINILSCVGMPKKDGNYNLPEKIKNNQYLFDLNLSISQKDNRSYIVYSGETKNLLARAREHSFGGNETGCLAISEYDKLKNFVWSFSYLKLQNFNNSLDDDKSLRVYGEQIFRTKYGFPILCSK